MATGTNSVQTVGATKSGDLAYVLSRHFLHESQQMNTIPNLLRQEASKMVPGKSIRSGQRFETNKFAPILSVNDLSKSDTEGDTVRIRVMHDLVGQPTMCCDPLEGNEEDLSFANFELSINQTRHGVNTGCTMDRLRLNLSAKQEARPLLQQWHSKIEQERCLYHLAGARGHFYNPSNMIIPKQTDPTFGSKMINCVTAPTHCRHFYGGDAESLDGSCGTAITKTDVFNLESISKIKMNMEEAAHPLLPIKLEGGEDAVYLLLVTPAQWFTFKRSADGKDYEKLVAQATARGTACGQNGKVHPLFRGDCLMYENILVRKYSQPVRFLPGQPVYVSNDDDAATTSVQRLDSDAGFAVDRAMLIGGQALAEAYGSVADAEGKMLGKLNFAFWEGTWDGGDKARVHIKYLSGMKKIRFASRGGKVYDRGVAVLDTAVDLPRGSSC